MNNTISPSQLLSTRVRDHILADLASLGASSGQRYFTEAQLSERYQVSRNTVRRAMGELEKRGYLQRQRGRGSIILQLPGKQGDPAPLSHTARAAVKSNQHRLITILPEWDDSTEGFYAARIIHAMTAIEELRPYAIEIRHPNDPLDFEEPAGLTCLAIDPRKALPHRLAALAAAGARIVIVTPSSFMPFALNLYDDVRHAVAQAVRIMAGAGHQKIGIILHDLAHNDYRMALHGYLDAHDELNLAIQPGAIERCFETLEESSLREFPVDQIRAWICTYAAGAYHLAMLARKQNLRIPDDVSIICLDDPADHYLGVVGQELSVVRSDPEATARMLGGCLNRWDDGLRGQSIALPMQYFDRRSVVSPLKV